jgi:DUF4097 and DUF4098 domain-containing protein YvlB
MTHMTRIHSFVTTALAVLLLAPAAHAAQDIDQSLQTGPRPDVEISNVAGSVKVTAWDQQVVKVTGRIDNDKDRFEMEGDASRVVIKVRRESGHYKDDDGTRLDILVPAGASLEVNTVSADVSIDGVKGTQRLESVSGNIVSTVFDEQLDLRTISGDATITGSGGKARVFAESTSGDLRARGLASEAEANSVSGDLVLELGTVPHARFKSVSGDIDATLGLAPEGRLDVQSISGDVEMTFKEPVNAEFDVESHSGDIDNCFGPKSERKSKYAPGTELRFTEGDGSGRVRIDTLSGDIDFCKR